MGNRGQKRAETVDELPADKRACSSLEFRPSSSNSSVQTPMNSTNSTLETHDGDMETSSSSSGSTRSEGEGEKDSAYGSCDSDGEPRHSSLLRDYQRRRSSGDHGKFKKVLSSLGQEVEESVTLSALTELCELLSFCSDGSLSSMMADSLSPILVKLARHESNPDIMLLAIRAITYLCDVHPRSSGFLVRHDAVPALCQRLMAIEFLDVAEQVCQKLVFVFSTFFCVSAYLCWHTKHYLSVINTYVLSFHNAVFASTRENITRATTCMLTVWGNYGCFSLY